jgi:hypothetical protein
MELPFKRTKPGTFRKIYLRATACVYYCSNKIIVIADAIGSSDDRKSQFAQNIFLVENELFYMFNYKCQSCAEQAHNLFMVVY